MMICDGTCDDAHTTAVVADFNKDDTLYIN